MEPKTWQIISDKKLWDSSLLANSTNNFLQSSSFGDFHEKLGNQVWRLGKINLDKVVSFAQVVKIKSKLGSFLYVPWGPLLEQEHDIDDLLEVLKEIGTKEEANFIRLEPRVEIKDWQSLGLRLSPNYTQPECSLLLDLTKSLEELRKGLSESTHYNIGWVARQGVKVEVSNNPGDIEIFLNLLKETAARQKFSLHQSLDYYKEQFLAFEQNSCAKLYLAQAPQETGAEPLAAAIVIYFGDTVTYLHAASSSQQQKLRAPYLMQWKIIEDAKNSGARMYDFWGVAPTDKPNEAWAGVSAFKKSFGGEKICYPKPYDLVLKKQYYTQNLLEKLRPIIKKVIGK